MTRRRTLAATLFLLALLSNEAFSQAWRRTAATIGPAPRVLLIGTRPEDEDNALLAWLGLGRGVETAFLSLTRGEGSPNVAGSERQSALAVLRTAEVLAERQRDGAHQYFTRAYDFGSATELQRAILVDPQTSGGLLVAVPPDRVAEYLSLIPEAVEVGEVLAKQTRGLLLA